MGLTVYKYQDVICDPASGRPVAGVSVTVKNHADGSLATLYDEAGEVVQPNPVLTDSLGLYSFWCPVGTYDLVCTAGNKSATRTGVYIDGFVDLSGGVVGFATAADMNGDLVHPANTIAWVTNDPTPANNGTWRLEGGVWVQASFDRVANLETIVKPAAFLKNLFPSGNLAAGFAQNPLFEANTTIVPTSDSVFTSRGITYVAQCSNTVDNAFDVPLDGDAHGNDYFYAECYVYAPTGVEYPDTNLLVVEGRGASNNIVAGTTITKSYAVIDANHRRYYSYGRLPSSGFNRATLRTKGSAAGTSSVSGYTFCASRLDIDPATNAVPVNDWGSWKEFGGQLRKDLDTAESLISGNAANIAANTAGITALSAALYANSPDYYVDASRPDDTGDGKTAATAKKTIQAAINAAASGDIVLVAAGTYVENDTATHGLNVGKTLTIQASGAAIVRASAGAARLIYTSGASEVLFSGPFTFDGQGATKLYLPSSLFTGQIVFDGVSFQGFPEGEAGIMPYSQVTCRNSIITSTTTGGYLFQPQNNAAVTLQDCTIVTVGAELVDALGSGTISIDGCMTSVNGSPSKLIFKRGTGVISVTGNSSFTFGRACLTTTVISTTSSSTSGKVFFTDSSVTLLGVMRSNILDLRYCDAPEIERSTFTLPGALSMGLAAIRTVDLSLKAWDNTITVGSASPCSPIYASSAGAAVVADIRRNKITTLALSGYQIIVGSDGDPGAALRNKCDGSIIEENYLFGPNWSGTVTNPADNLLHSIILGWSKGAIRRNYVIGGGHGIVAKGDAMDYAGAEGVHDNVVINASYDAVRNKGVKNLPVYNNTLISDATKPATTLVRTTYNQDAGAQDPTGGQGQTLKNNLLIGAPGSELVSIDTYAAPGAVLDHNAYFSTDGSDVMTSVGGATYASFAALQAAGFEAHGINSDPQVVPGIYEPTSTSPLRGAGEDVGLSVDYWGRKRTSPPDIGAMQYV